MVSQTMTGYRSCVFGIVMLVLQGHAFTIVKLSSWYSLPVTDEMTSYDWMTRVWLIQP